MIGVQTRTTDGFNSSSILGHDVSSPVHNLIDTIAVRSMPDVDSGEAMDGTVKERSVLVVVVVGAAGATLASSSADIQG